ncbi:MAG: glycine cleavage system aminomethyltransferase GcvT [Hyphomicrobium sp.]
MSSLAPSQCPPPILRTPLHALHLARGAVMAPFAGYDMPIQYPTGVLKEHLHTRAAAGLFDVSHMGQLILRAKSGDAGDAARALERLVPVDILGLQVGRQRYALFTNEQGGVRDDLMVANRGDHLLLVVNAACKLADQAHLRAHLFDDCEIERLDRALIALQGPSAEAALARLAPGVETMRFMDVRDVDIAGARCIVSRSGYTGEDGFEISVANADAERLALALLADPTVAPIGLGARDSLRLEAGLCLYGAELDTETTPVEAGLAWAIQAQRRRGGARAGGFAGADVILDQLELGPKRSRVGLLAEGRAPVRTGAPLFETENSASPIGRVTSGGFGPSLNRPVAMGYAPAAMAQPGARRFAEVRGQRLAVTVTALPFVRSNFKRG